MSCALAMPNYWQIPKWVILFHASLIFIMFFPLSGYTDIYFRQKIFLLNYPSQKHEIYQVFVEYLLCVKSCLRCWVYSDKKTIWFPALLGSTVWKSWILNKLMTIKLWIKICDILNNSWVNEEIKNNLTNENENSALKSTGCTKNSSNEVYGDTGPSQETIKSYT